MSRDLFCDVELTGYQKMRAIVATLNNMALLANSDDTFTHGSRAMYAIDAAEALLEELGIVDPDTLSS